MPLTVWMLDGEILNPIRAPVPLCLAFSSNLPSVMVGHWGVGVGGGWEGGRRHHWSVGGNGCYGDVLSMGNLERSGSLSSGCQTSDDCA